MRFGNHGIYINSSIVAEGTPIGKKKLSFFFTKVKAMSVHSNSTPLDRFEKSNSIYGVQSYENNH
jgi:hypothetical protein